MNRARSLLALALVLASSRTAMAQAGKLSAADDRAVRALIADYAPTTLTKNWDKVAGLYAGDAVRLPPNEPTLAKSGLRAWLEKYPPISKFTVALVQLDGNGDLAVGRGTFTITVTIPGQPAPVNDNGKWISVYRKQADGSWKCVEDMWSSDNPVPVAPAK